MRLQVNVARVRPAKQDARVALSQGSAFTAKRAGRDRHRRSHPSAKGPTVRTTVREIRAGLGRSIQDLHGQRQPLHDRRGLSHYRLYAGSGSRLGGIGPHIRSPGQAIVVHKGCGNAFSTAHENQSVSPKAGDSLRVLRKEMRIQTAPAMTRALTPPALVMAGRCSLEAFVARPQPAVVSDSSRWNSDITIQGAYAWPHVRFCERHGDNLSVPTRNAGADEWRHPHRHDLV